MSFALLGRVFIVTLEPRGLNRLSSPASRAPIAPSNCHAAHAPRLCCRRQRGAQRGQGGHFKSVIALSCIHPLNPLLMVLYFSSEKNAGATRFPLSLFQSTHPWLCSVGGCRGERRMMLSSGCMDVTCPPSFLCWNCVRGAACWGPRGQGRPCELLPSGHGG